MRKNEPIFLLDIFLLSIYYNYQKCLIDTESPSSLDDRCQRLRSSIPSLQNSTVHLFDENKNYITTCYPIFDGISKEPKGIVK